MSFAPLHDAPLQEGARIRRLWPSDVGAYCEHLLRLDDDARYSRFGTVMSDEVLAAHANGCFRPDTLVFGYFFEGVIRGVAELHILAPGARACTRTGEAAFSVEKAWRHSGLGSAFVERLIFAARNRGLRSLVISCLPQNLAMQNLAKKFGARLKFETDEVTGKIIVELPTVLTILAEFVEESLDFTTALFDLQKRIFHPTAPVGRAT
jgi:RimJ/RimL family protein N-acetyltransferase